MEYELFILSTYDVKKVAKILANLVMEISKDDVKYQVVENEYIYIGQKLFDINIEIEDISDLEFIRNNYKIDVNLSISINVFSREPVKGLDELFKVIIKFLKYNNGNVLLLKNGSEQILRRECDILILNEDVHYIPYGYFDIEYKKEKLESK